MWEELFLARYRFDSVGCTSDILPSLSLATTSRSSINISMYPNPATKWVTIRSNEVFPVGCSASISDIAGKEIASYTLAGKGIDIDLGNIAGGVYLCSIQMPGQPAEVRKLVVTH
jgi:hypothetical protein